MSNNVKKDLEYYESLPYTITLRKDEDGDFIARIQELPRCIAHGATEAEALGYLRVMLRLWIEDALQAGDPVPEPEHEDVLPSGKWVQRVPRKLHRNLVRLAQQENVSLNQLVTSILSEAIAGKSCIQAVRTCVADVLAAQANPTHPDMSSWAWYGQEQQPWQCTEYSLPQGGISKALSRVKKVALPWGGNKPEHEYRWSGEEDDQTAIIEDYEREHAISAQR